MIDQNHLNQVLTNFQEFARTFLSIRTKSGRVEPFKFNRAQQYLNKRLDEQLKKTGKVRAVILKGRQQGCCFTPDMRVLTDDLRWVQIGDIKKGQKVVACDEHTFGQTKAGRKKSRQFKTAIVEQVATFVKPAYEVLLDNGAKIKVTGDHRMLTKKRGGCDAIWRYVETMKVGDEIRVATRPPNYEPSYEDGWAAGMIDGEGSCRLSGAKRLSIHQIDGPILQRLKNYFDNLDIPYKEVIDCRDSGINKLGRKPVHRLDVHRLPYLIELLARCRPERFTNDRWYEGHELPGKAAQDGIKPWSKIISIKEIGKKKVIDLQTSEKTYICEGLVSHNSTFVQARFFHKVATQKGKKAFILTHETEATKNLFTMTRRYYDELPKGLVPAPDVSNAKELNFSCLNSGYAVATAKNKAAGRSQTVQLFHGSEVAYWDNASEHSKGVLQAVPSESGTEVILESTANGLGNYFHQMWLSATSGESEYQAIFIPWYWQEEYTAPLREGESGCTEEERELLEQYQEGGLTLNHLYWRRIKLKEFSNDYDTALERFCVEYPMDALEAFRNPIADRFIHAKLVMRARKESVDTDSPLVIGVDPALKDKDRTAIIRRKGRKAYKLETFINLNTMEIAGKVKRIIDEEKPAKVCIDVIGIGAGVYDRLRELGYECVEAVNVACASSSPEEFRNLRAELWHEMREWLASDLPVEIPDKDELQGDLTALGYKYDSSGRLQIEAKDKIKERGLPSPDAADALALTFAVGQFLSAGNHQTNFIPAHHQDKFI